MQTFVPDPRSVVYVVLCTVCMCDFFGLLSLSTSVNKEYKKSFEKQQILVLRV